MKKLIGILAAIGLTSTAGTTVVACNSQSNISKMELKTKLVNLTIRNLQCVDSANVLLGRVIDLNKDSGVQLSDLQIQDYQPASYQSSGSAKITAKPQSHFKGEVNVSIAKLEQTNINEILYGKLGLGRFNNSEEAVLRSQEILDFLGLKNLVSLEPAQNGKIHVKANDESLIGEADFTFELFGNLQVLLTGKLNLGYVSSPEKATFKAKVILSELNLDKEVELSKPNNGKIHVKAKANSAVKGEADFSYLLTKEIAKLLENKTNLGYVPDSETAMKKAQTIINNIPELNNHVNLRETQNGKIVVTPKDESLTGEATFTYQLQKSIAKLLENKTNLGYVNDSTRAEIDARRILDGIPELRNSVRLEPAQNGKIHVIPSDDSLMGEAFFEYQVRKNIADVLKDQLNLGEVTSVDEAETKMKAILVKNDLIDKVEWQVYANENKITVLGEADSVRGIVHFIYALKVEKNIEKLLKIIKVEGDIANTKESVIKETIRLNPEAKLQSSDLEIVSLIPATIDQDGKAFLKTSKNSSFTGKIVIYITRLSHSQPEDPSEDEKMNLKDFITKTVVQGDVANTQAEVFNKVLELNKYWIAEYIEIITFEPASKLKDGFITLMALQKSPLIGAVNVTITKLTK